MTHVVGVSGIAAARGLRFGGPELLRFNKNLRLPPTKGGSGLRFDAAEVERLSFALMLESHLERCSRYPYVPRRRAPLLPTPVAKGRRQGLMDLSSMPLRAGSYSTPFTGAGRKGVLGSSVIACVIWK
ncbi:MAG TPA: hypothetical protein VHV77_10200 [Pirellulales bacterium]|nr:hypothetical protein [Pirellulales bacterium]